MTESSVANFFHQLYFKKTEAGLKEMQNRSDSLSHRERGLLILTNGQLNLFEYSSIYGQGAEAAIFHLFSLGMIDIVNEPQSANHIEIDESINQKLDFAKNHPTQSRVWLEDFYNLAAMLPDEASAKSHESSKEFKYV